MTKMYILYRNGSMYFDHLSKHDLNWIKVNEIKCNVCYKETKKFLDRYGLKPTIYNCGNLQKYGKIVLSKPIAEKIMKDHNIEVIQ